MTAGKNPDMVAQLEGVHELLPTFLFILGAYAVYALLRLSARRPLTRRGPRFGRLSWLPLAAGAGTALCLLWLVLTGVPDERGKDLRLAGIVGLSAGESFRQPEVRLEPPAPAVGAAAPPTFVLVHPETPVALMLPDKAASPLKGRPVVKPQSLRAGAAGKRVPLAKAAPKEKTTAKDKGMARHPGKSKKSGAAGNKTARTG